MKISNTNCLSINCDIQPIQDYNLEFNPILHAIRACECVIICIKLTSTRLNLYRWKLTNRKESISSPVLAHKREY